MYRLLKKIRGEEEVAPAFGRYYSARKSWLSEYEDCETVLPQFKFENSSTHGCSTVKSEAAFGVDVEDHIYEEIDDITPYSPIKSYIYGLVHLTQQIESDFGEKSQEEKDASNDVPTPTQDATPSTSSPMTIRCREKCEKWLNQLSAVNPTDFVIPVPFSPIDDSSDECRANSSNRIRRRPNIRKMSAAKRQELLRKIEANWFDSSDESSDESYPSLVSQESSSRLTQSSCTDQNETEKTSNEQSQWLRSSSEESSGIFEGNSATNKSGGSSRLSSESLENIKNSGSDSAFSEIDADHLPSFRPRIGFGMNRWYRHTV